MTENDTSQYEPLTSESVAPMPSKRPSLNLPKKKLIIAGGVFAAILIFAGIFFFLGKKSAETSTKQKQAEAEMNSENGEVDFVANNLEKDPTPTPIKNLTPTIDKPTVTKILQSTKDFDGFVTSEGEVDIKKDIQIGRNVDYVARGLVSFDLTSLPTGITIKAAQLRLYEVSAVGTPYTSTGEVRVDHMSFGDSLDESDYALPALISNIATLSISKRVGWKETDVTDAVKDDLANARTRSQYRVHFSQEVTGGTKQGDFIFFVSANKTESPNIPQLVVEYY